MEGSTNSQHRSIFGRMEDGYPKHFFYNRGQVFLLGKKKHIKIFVFKDTQGNFLSCHCCFDHLGPLLIGDCLATRKQGSFLHNETTYRAFQGVLPVENLPFFE